MPLGSAKFGLQAGKQEIPFSSLLVAGGGGGGAGGYQSYNGAGGGGGGFREDTTDGYSLIRGETLTISVGGGGTRGSNGTAGTQGNNSIIGSILFP